MLVANADIDIHVLPVKEMMTEHLVLSKRLQRYFPTVLYAVQERSDMED